MAVRQSCAFPLPHPEPVAAAPRRLLLAEDNPLAADLIAMLVRRLGHAVDRVANGLDAVDAVLRAERLGAPYGLLLIDAMMPVLTGSEATRRLRSAGVDAQRLPIIAVTAATDRAEVREYLDAGMEGYLAKPVALADLAGCIDAWAPGLTAPAPGRERQPGAALRQRYLLRKSEVIEQFERACDAADCPPHLAAELRDHLHKLAGTAGSFGEVRVSKAAATGEALLLRADPATLHGAVKRSYALLRAAG